MRRVALFFLLLAGATFGASAASVSNDDVVKLLSAGLAEQTITQLVDSADPAKFDTSTQGLIKLKKAGASDSLIQRILSKQSGKEVTATAANAVVPTARAVKAAKTTTGGECQSEVPNMPDRVVLRAGGAIVPLSFKKVSMNSDVDGGSVIGSLLTLGIIKAKGSSSMRLDGNRASIRLQDRSPELLDVGVVYGSSPEDAMYLLRLTVQDNSRVVEVSRAEQGITGATERQGQFDETVRIPLSVELVSDQCTYNGKLMSVYRMKPKSPLESGEYAVFTGKIGWDFGVE